MKALLFTLVALLLGLEVGAANLIDSYGPKDISVELIMSGSIYEVGEPIPFEFKVTNKSLEDMTVTTYSEPVFEPIDYIVEVSTGCGTVKPHPVQSRIISMIGSSQTLSPGASVTYSGFVNYWATLDKPGKFDVQLTWTIPDRGYPSATWTSRKRASSPVKHITIIESSKQSINQRCDQTVQQWKSATSKKERINALYMLGFTLDSRAIPLVVAASRERDMSSAATSVLYLFPEQEAVREALMDELRERGVSEQQSYMLSYFKMLNNQTVPVLLKWLKEGDTEQRVGALRAISMTEKYYIQAECKQPLLNALKDSEPAVRRGAIVALGKERFGDVIDYVLPIAESDPDSSVRSQAIIALGWYKDDKAIPLLKKTVSETDLSELITAKSMSLSDKQRSAIYALQGIASPAAIEALEEFAKSGSKPVQEQCRTALDQLRRKAQQ